MYENFLAYRRYFWKLTLATTLVLVISYISTVGASPQTVPP